MIDANKEIVQEPEKIILRTPFSALSSEELRKNGVSYEKELDLKSIPDLLIEHHMSTRTNPEKSPQRYIKTPFSFKRYVDKEGNLHFWSIDMPPQLMDDTCEVLDKIVDQDPSYDAEKLLLFRIKENLPNFRITPDSGAIMSYPDGVSLNATPNKNFINWSDWEKAPREASINELDGKFINSLRFTANIEDYLFVGKRKDQQYVLAESEIQYDITGMKSVISKLQNILQSGLISEKRIRELVNPCIAVYTSPIDDDGGDEEVAA